MWRDAEYISKIGTTGDLVPRPFAKLKHHEFDGQLHWEVDKRDYPLERIMAKYGTPLEIGFVDQGMLAENNDIKNSHES